MGCQWSRPQHKRAKLYKLTDKDQQSHADAQAGDKAAPNKQQSPPAVSAQHHGGTTDSTKAQPAQQTAHVLATATTAPTATNKAKLDPKDFMLTGLQSETRVKLPGSVNGQQFIIENCKDCDLFVMDTCASVTIDDCTNCRIIIGPTEASVFMRDCSNISLATITRQLRCRDCTDCSLLLLCRTRPIIESSRGMAFGCYDAPYVGLAAQMAAGQLSPFHNFWGDVFDFTPAGNSAAPSAASAAQQDCSEQQQGNWTLLPSTATVVQLLGNPSLPDQVLQLLGVSAASPAAVQPAGAACAAASSSHVVDSSCEACACSTDADAIALAVEEVTAAAAVARPVNAVEGQGAAEVCGPSQADCMCVIHTARASQQDAGVSSTSGSNDASSQQLFVLFAAGQQAAALDWVYRNITLPHRQHHQQQQQRQAKQQQQGQEETDSGAVSCSPHVGEQHALACAALPVVLSHTNGGSIPAAVLQQMAKAVGWTKQQLKQLGVTHAAAGAKGKSATGSTTACVGLEFVCADEGSRQQLEKAAADAGALCSSSMAAARLFRDLGVDG